MNSDRIPIILDVIRDLWLDNPDLHLMQLLGKVLSLEETCCGLNIDDQLLLEKLRAAPERQALVAKKLDAEIARLRPHAARLLGKKAT
ncbi:MAG: hypothetical protein A2Y12_16250 [Planctomycetes bacterium GWF2_42_9]|nr:MAG: hypothetical protein A2Y12_16250 [Planctomycetes bacterium GWF2_42_9]